jgi:hypothetical protein
MRPVNAFGEMLERARKYDGCLDLSISADPVDAAHAARDPGTARRR